MTWLTLRNIYVTNDHEYVPLVVNTSRSSPHSLLQYYRVCKQINTTGATSGAGTAYCSGAHEFTPGFWWGSCHSIFSFMCMVVCPSILFLFVIVLAILWITHYDYGFGIFKLFLLQSCERFHWDIYGIPYSFVFVGFCFMQLYRPSSADRGQIFILYSYLLNQLSRMYPNRGARVAQLVS